MIWSPHLVPPPRVFFKNCAFWQHYRSLDRELFQNSFQGEDFQKLSAVFSALVWTGKTEILACNVSVCGPFSPWFDVRLCAIRARVCVHLMCIMCCQHPRPYFRALQYASLKRLLLLGYKKPLPNSFIVLTLSPRFSRLSDTVLTSTHFVLMKTELFQQQNVL